jgi:hypothetical protein
LEDQISIGKRDPSHEKPDRTGAPFLQDARTAKRNPMELRKTQNPRGAQRAELLAHDSGRKRARIWLGLVAATGVLGAVAAAAYLERTDAENRALIARYTALVESKQEDIAKTSALLDENQRRAAKHAAELERERQALEQQLRQVQEKKDMKTTPKSEPHKNGTPPPSRTNCDPHDPICGELSR